MENTNPYRGNSLQQKRIDETIDYLSVSYLNLAPTLYNMKMRASNKIDTMCVGPDGKGLYNVDFVSGLNIYQLRFVIMHEAFHVLLRHIDRYNAHVAKKVPDSKTDPIYINAFNIASDIFINDNLMKSNSFEAIDDMFTAESADKMFDVKYDDLINMNAESLYDVIIKKMKSNQKASGNGSSSDSNNSSSNNNNSDGSGKQDSNNKKDSSKSNKNSNGNSKSGDSKKGSESGQEDCEAAGEQSTSQSPDSKPDGSHNNASGKDSESYSEFSKDICQDEIIAQEYGCEDYSEATCSNKVHDQSDIELILEDNNVNWDEILDKFMYNVSGRGVSNKTWRRPNRYYRNIYPCSKGRMRDKNKDILISIDVSGSMDAIKLSKAAAVVGKLAKKYSIGIKYSLFNDRYTDDKNISSVEALIKDIKCNCGGGTSIVAATHNQNFNQSGIVIISDMIFNHDDKHIIKYLDEIGKEYFLIDVGHYKEGYYSGEQDMGKYADETRYIKIGR